ncbi:MAG: hypothetical protein RLZ53_1048 [Actinomycetota bacterium]|jgi:hypothetical protein
MTKTDDVLAARYGKKKSGGRIAVLGFVGVLLTLFFGFGIYWNFIAKPDVSIELLSFAPVDANHISGKYTALTGDQAGTCVVKALDGSGQIVGYLELEIPAGTSDKVAYEVIVKTVVPASILKADTCSVK